MPSVITQRTIGDFITLRTRLYFHCANCVGLREIDLRVLGDRLGTDHDFIATAHLPASERLPVVCAGCGGNPVGYILSPWTLPR